MIVLPGGRWGRRSPGDVMDSLNSDVPGALAPDQLCAAAAHELLIRSYTLRTLNRPR